MTSLYVKPQLGPPERLLKRFNNQVGIMQNIVLQWRNFNSCCNLEWRWCDSWIGDGKKSQYLAPRCQHCHFAAKYSLRDHSFNWIRLHEGYARLGANMKSFYCNKFQEEHWNVFMWKSMLITACRDEFITFYLSMPSPTRNFFEVISCMVRFKPCWIQWEFAINPISLYLIHYMR